MLARVSSAARIAPRILPLRNMLVPRSRIPRGRLLCTSAENKCNENVHKTLLRQMGEATKAGDQAKMHELVEKLKMLAKAQMESEKVESIKWAREYVTHSMLLWFVSIAVGLRAICAVLGGSERLTFPVVFNISFNEDGIRTSARLERNATPDIPAAFAKPDIAKLTQPLSQSGTSQVLSSASTDAAP